MQRGAENAGRPASQLGHRNVQPILAADIGNTGFALSDFRLAAITPVTAEQPHTRTEGGAVMHVHVVGNAEVFDHLQDGMVMAKQVMQLRADRPLGAQQPNQGR